MKEHLVSNACALKAFPGFYRPILFIVNIEMYIILYRLLLSCCSKSQIISNLIKTLKTLQAVLPGVAVST